MKKNLKKMFSNLCCSVCKSDFDEDSIKLVRNEDGLQVVRLVCQKCGKSFGIAFLGLNDNNFKNDDDTVFEVQEGPEPIDYDDVIDAHRFIKNLAEHWKDYIPKETD